MKNPSIKTLLEVAEIYFSPFNSRTYKNSDALKYSSSDILGFFGGIKTALSADLDSASCVHVSPELCCHVLLPVTLCCCLKGGFVVNSSAKLLEFHVCRASDRDSNRAVRGQKRQAKNPNPKAGGCLALGVGTRHFGSTDVVIQQIFE